MRDRGEQKLKKWEKYKVKASMVLIKLCCKVCFYVALRTMDVTQRKQGSEIFLCHFRFSEYAN
jgi:hypothetical protein